MKSRGIEEWALWKEKFKKVELSFTEEEKEKGLNIIEVGSKKIRADKIIYERGKDEYFISGEILTPEIVAVKTNTPLKNIRSTEELLKKPMIEIAYYTEDNWSWQPEDW